MVDKKIIEPVHIEAVVQNIYELIQRLDGSKTYKTAIKKQLDEWHPKIMTIKHLAVYLPLLSYAGIKGEITAEAVTTASACLILFLGADLLDNIADNELTKTWKRVDPSIIELSAVTLVGPLPYKMLFELEKNNFSPSRLLSLFGAFCETQILMTSGQNEDILFSGAKNVNVESFINMVNKKSGAEISLFAKAGAMTATENSQIISNFKELGLNIGIASQLGSDLKDLTTGNFSKDLLNGKKTLPLIYALYTLKGEEKNEFITTLDKARHDTSCHKKIREVLLKCGSLIYIGMLVEVYYQKALKSLMDANLLEPAKSALMEIIKGVSLISPREMQ